MLAQYGGGQIDAIQCPQLSSVMFRKCWMVVSRVLRSYYNFWSRVGLEVQEK